MSNSNPEPSSTEITAHPVATGVGAVGGGATGGALGLAVGGPVGGIIGAVIGAVAGGLGGNIVGETIEATPDAPTHSPEAPPAESEIAFAPPGEKTGESSTLEGALRTHGLTLEAQDTPRATPSHETIALRAWSYYEEEGRPEGQDLRHWLQAEEDLRKAFSPV